MITADDGAYHAVELPDWTGPRFDHSFELTPDGRQLAYVYRLGERSDDGVAVVDLETGSVRRIPVGGADTPWPQGVLMMGLQWSPGGTYLLWTGQPITLGGDMIAGLIAPDGTATAMPHENQDELWTVYAVGDDGEVAILQRLRTRTWARRPGWRQHARGLDHLAVEWTARRRRRQSAEDAVRGRARRVRRHRDLRARTDGLRPAPRLGAQVATERLDDRRSDPAR